MMFTLKNQHLILAIYVNQPDIKNSMLPFNKADSQEH